MKKIFIKSILVSFFVAGIAVFNMILAQGPALPPTTQGAAGDQPPGGGAPIGEGIFLLSLLSAGYGARKASQAKKTQADKA